MATSRFHDDAPDVDDLYADLATADLQPLWRQEGLLSRTPGRLTPHIWRWAAVDHEAADDADLFLVCDWPALEALGLARTESVVQQEIREDDAR